MSADQTRLADFLPYLLSVTSNAVSDRIADEYRALAAQLGIAHVDCIPLSALRGDNMIERSQNTPWYGGPALLEKV